MKRYVQLGLRIRANSEAWSVDRIWGPGGIDEPQAKDEGFARYASVDTTWDPCSQTILVPVGVCDAPYRVKLMKAADAAVWNRIKQLQDIRVQLQKAIDRLGGDDNATEPPEDVVTPATWLAPPISDYYLMTVATPDGGPAVQIVKVQRTRVDPGHEYGEAYAIGSCESLAELPKGRAVQLYLAGVHWDDRPLDDDALQSLQQAARECVTRFMEDCAERSALLCTISSLTLENASRSDVVPVLVPMPETPPQAPGRVANVIYRLGVVNMHWDGTAGIQVSKRPAGCCTDPLAFGKVVELHPHGLLSPLTFIGGDITLAKVAWDNSLLSEQALAELKRVAASVVDASASGDVRDALKSAIASLTLDDARNETPVVVQLTQGVASHMVECEEYRFTARQDMDGGGLCVRLEDNGRGMASSDKVGMVTLGAMSDLKSCLHDHQVLASVCIPADDELDDCLLERLSDAAARKLVNVGCTDGPCPEDLVRKAVNAFKGCDDDDDSEADDCDADDCEDDEDNSEDDENEVDCDRMAFLVYREDDDYVVKLKQLESDYRVEQDCVEEVEQEADVELPEDVGDWSMLASVCVVGAESLRGDTMDRLIDAATDALRDAGFEDETHQNPRDAVVAAANEWLNRNCERSRVVVPPKRVVDVVLPPKRIVDVTLPPKRVVDVALPPKPAGNSVQQPGRYIQW